MDLDKDSKDMLIFLVDDDELNLKLTRFHLRRQGYSNVSTYSNGNACLNSLEQKPRIIFLDLNMTGISGLEVMKKVKEVDERIFIIMFSGEDDPDVIARVKSEGAFEYIIKGPNAVEMTTKVLDRIKVLS